MPARTSGGWSNGMRERQHRGLIFNEFGPTKITAKLATFSRQSNRNFFPMKKTKRPTEIPAVVAAWRKQMVAEFEFSDPASLALLDSATTQLERMLHLRERIEAEGELVRDRFGCPKPHPAVAMERQASNLFRLLCRDMGVSCGDDEAARIPRSGK